MLELVARIVETCAQSLFVGLVLFLAALAVCALYIVLGGG